MLREAKTRPTPTYQMRASGRICVLTPNPLLSCHPTVYFTVCPLTSNTGWLNHLQCSGLNSHSTLTAGENETFDRCEKDLPVDILKINGLPRHPQTSLSLESCSLYCIHFHLPMSQPFAVPHICSSCLFVMSQLTKQILISPSIVPTLGPQSTLWFSTFFSHVLENSIVLPK